jgi:clan AA aspartic protease (TIGR02281 family)
MATHRLSSFTCCTLILTLFGFASPAASPARGEPLRIAADGLISLEVVLNGNRVRFMLDTGSSRSAISSRLARSLDLAPMARATVSTAAGAAERVIVRLEEVAVGVVVKRGLLATVLEGADMAVFDAGYSGILGQDFLFDQNYTLDYRAGRLLWTPEATSAPPDATPLALHAAHGRWLVTLPQDPASARALTLVPDSGASDLVVFDYAAQAMALWPVACCARVSTVTGGQYAQLVMLPQLKVGAVLLRSQKAVVVHRPKLDASSGDGLLPLSLFAGVTFDARSKTMWVRAR